MEKITKQHVQLPHVNPNDVTTTPRERLIYLYIKRHMDKDTKEAFPSLARLKEESGVSIPTLRDCIAILVKAGYMSVRKDGRKQIYKFNDYKQFEPVSYELLDNKDISFTEKQVLICNLENMKDKGLTGRIEYTNKELSEIINMPESTISKSFRSLIKKGYMLTIKQGIRDPETGCRREIKEFDLQKIGQAIFYTLVDHEDRITENTQDIEELKKEFQAERAARINAENNIKFLLQKFQEIEEKKREPIIAD